MQILVFIIPGLQSCCKQNSLQAWSAGLSLLLHGLALQALSIRSLAQLPAQLLAQTIAQLLRQLQPAAGVG